MTLVGRSRRLGRSPVVHFVVSALLAVVLVGVLAARLVQDQAQEEALRDAKDLTVLTGRGIVAPAITQGVLDGDPAAIARLDRLVRTSVPRPPVTRVKVWAPDGTIIYSDEPRLIGERYPLGADELESLRTGGIEAELSDLDEPENRFEQSDRKVREVYLGIPTAGGRRLLFETYQRDSAIEATGDRIWRDLAPILIGTLLVVWLLQVPLAASLARRLRRAQDEREALLHQAVRASEDERQRIARDLHDGPVQDLASVSYGLSAAADALRRRPEAAEEELATAGSQVRQAMRQLRTLLVDLYPDSLHRQGLDGAISDLLARLEARSIATSLEIEPDVSLDPGREALVFRVVQEALRNVLAHAEASSVAVTIACEDGGCRVEVVDDGRGLAPSSPDDRPRFGLRMLGDLVREHGGTLDVGDAEGGGTRLALVLPARVVA